jgi:hypothetical protein
LILTTILIFYLLPYISSSLKTSCREKAVWCIRHIQYYGPPLALAGVTASDIETPPTQNFLNVVNGNGERDEHPQSQEDNELSYSQKFQDIIKVIYGVCMEVLKSLRNRLGGIVLEIL